MNRKKLFIVYALLMIAVSSCGEDAKEGDPIDVDRLPPGDATGTAASGTFDYNEVVASSNCPATVDGITLPAEGGTWATEAMLTQDEGYLVMDLEDASGRQSFSLDGGISSSGTFRVGDTYLYGEMVTFVHLMDGQFNDGMDRFDGESRIRVIAPDGTDCEIDFEFTGTRR